MFPTHLLVGDQLDLVARVLDALLRAEDEHQVGGVLHARDRDLCGGRQLQVGQLPALRSEDEAVVFLRDRQGAARLRRERPAAVIPTFSRATRGRQQHFNFSDLPPEIVGKNV